MARELQVYAIELWLDPAAYRLRGGDAVGTAPQSDADEIRWDVRSTGWKAGTAATWGGGWLGTGPGEVYHTRATLAYDGGFIPDALFDVEANGERWIRTPTLIAAGVRSWVALEVLFDEPDDTTTARFRLWDGVADRWWDGAAWELADGTDQWNTAAEVQAHVSTFPTSTRALAVTCWLSTSSTSYSPAFFGARLAYGCRVVSGADDALLRTVLASLRAGVTAYGVAQWETEAELAVLPIPGSTASTASDEWTYVPTDVLAVFDLTDDPDEEEALTGTFDAGEGTWTPTLPIPAGHVIRVEFAFRPEIVVRRHRDAEAIKRLPAIYIGPSGAAGNVRHAQGPVLVRNLDASPPTAVEVPGATAVDLPLEVRVIGELGADVERLAAALRAWIGGSGYRVLASPETGQVISVREVQPPEETTGLLASGVCEARGTWILTYLDPPTRGSTTVPLVAENGLLIDTVEA